MHLSQWGCSFAVWCPAVITPACATLCAKISQTNRGCPVIAGDTVQFSWIYSQMQNICMFTLQSYFNTVCNSLVGERKHMHLVGYGPAQYTNMCKHQNNLCVKGDNMMLQRICSWSLTSLCAYILGTGCEIQKENTPCFWPHSCHCFLQHVVTTRSLPETL